MKRVSILNTSKVIKTVKGTDGKIYYLAPRKPKFLPVNVTVAEGLTNDLKVTVSSV